MKDAAAIAVIRPDRQLEVLDADHRVRWRTGPTPGLLWAPGWGSGREPEGVLYSWPAWEPSGRRLACFRAAPQGGSAELVLLYDGGFRTDVLLQLDDRVPIYAQWSPDGARVAVLFQEGQRLGLSVTDPEDGATTELAQGSPLFFTWADATHVAAFVGDPEGRSRIGLFPADGGEPVPFAGTPGNFCAPVRVAGKVAYVAHDDGVLSLWLGDREGARRVVGVRGLAAMLPDPTGTRLAVALAPDDRSPYRDLHLLDVATGERLDVVDRPITAFLWSPAGDRLVLASTDPKSGSVAFRVHGLDGTSVALGEVRPSRDLRFYLRFFEQFAQSHPLIDPAGTALLVPGGLDRRGGALGLWRLPLDGGEPEQLGEGVLGVWGPPG